MVTFMSSAQQKWAITTSMKTAKPLNAEYVPSEKSAYNIDLSIHRILAKNIYWGAGFSYFNYKCENSYNTELLWRATFDKQFFSFYLSPLLRFSIKDIITICPYVNAGNSFQRFECNEFPQNKKISVFAFYLSEGISVNYHFTNHILLGVGYSVLSSFANYNKHFEESYVKKQNMIATYCGNENTRNKYHYGQLNFRVECVF